MKYFLIIFLLQNTQHNPVIMLNKQRVIYGEKIKITIRNNTSKTVIYHMDLEVLVGDFWGAADTDILNPAVDKVVTYKTQSLQPGKQGFVYYNTKLLSKNYVDTYSVYRVSMYYINSNNRKIENIIYSNNVEILNKNGIIK